MTNTPDGGTIDLGGGELDENISGAISGALNPNSDEALEHAGQYYESVRKMTTDVENISKNTGYSLDEIQKVKEYIFYETHDLGDGRIDRFDSDFMMAQSWQRLIEGRDIKEHDLTLLKHELLEHEYKDQGIPHNEAHILASYKYNYSQEAEDYHAKISKHQKT